MKKIIGCVIINYYSDGTVDTLPRAIDKTKRSQIEKQVAEFAAKLKGVK